MNNEDVFIIELDELYLNALSMAALITKFVMLDLSTDFSRLVYNSNLVVYDDVLLWSERLKKARAGDDVGVNEQEFILCYTCSYITASFAKDKEAFYKWFLQFESGEINDSNNFREVIQGAQSGVTAAMEKTEVCTKEIMAKKELLLNVLGTNWQEPF